MTDQKIAIVTGANTGLGYETSLALARGGYKVVLACRNQDKAETAIKRIRQKLSGSELDFMQLDLINRDSVKTSASMFSEKYKRLDLLVNNAGVMGPPHTITENGLELQFDANHVGHFLLTSRLMGCLEQSSDARIVNVSSLAGKWPSADIHFDNLNFEGNYESDHSVMGLPGFDAYCQSKLANILFSVELHNRLTTANKDIKAFVVHPGASNTNLPRHASPVLRFILPVLVQFMNVSKPAQGAESTLLAALGRDVKSGTFIGPTGKNGRTGKPGLCALPDQANDSALCARLWQLSEELIGETFNLNANSASTSGENYNPAIQNSIEGASQ